MKLKDCKAQLSTSNNTRLTLKLYKNGSQTDLPAVNGQYVNIQYDNTSAAMPLQYVEVKKDDYIELFINKGQDCVPQERYITAIAIY